MRLSGKRVLVLGASAGLGKAAAIEIVREGGRVCVAARRAERLAETVEACQGETFATTCDVSVEADCTRAVDEAVAALGGLDAVVYTPGISTFGPIDEITAEDWHRVLSTNLVGVSLVLNAAIRHLEASLGRFVVLSSIAIDDSPPRPFQATYVVSKRALEAMVEAWQGEHKSVGFTSIACGDTLSEFAQDEDVQKIIPIVQEWNVKGYMYGRMMEPIAVAEQVVNALASRETLRRIALTPAYPEALGEDAATDWGAEAVEHNRGQDVE